MFISATSPLVLCTDVQVCFKSFYLSLSFFLPARVAGNLIKRICASGWFVRMENNNHIANTKNYV